MKIQKKLLLLIGAAVLLSSCLKDNTSGYYNPNYGLVTFIQTSPDQPAIDVYFNNNKVNLSPVNYGDGIDYFQAYPGNRTVTFYNHSTQAKLYSDTITVAPGTAYSLFLTNTVVNPQIVLLKDTLIKPSAGNAGIRFVNLSADAPAADLAIQGGTVIASNRPFKGYTPFLPVSGNKTYNFEIRKAGTSTVLTTIQNVNLNSAFLYTVWLQGITSSSSPAGKLAIGIINNAYFN